MNILQKFAQSASDSFNGVVNWVVDDYRQGVQDAEIENPVRDTKDVNILHEITHATKGAVNSAINWAVNDFNEGMKVAEIENPLSVQKVKAENGFKMPGHG